MVVRKLKQLHLLLKMGQLAAATSLLKSKVIQLLIFYFVFKYRIIEHRQLVLDATKLSIEKKVYKSFGSNKHFLPVGSDTRCNDIFNFKTMQLYRKFNDLHSISHRRDSETVRRYRRLLL